jgi:hypothetical protein
MIEAAILFILLLVLVIFARQFEKKQIYYPEKEVSLPPASLVMKYEDVTLVTKDKVKINGWFIPADKPIATLIFCHGNAAFPVL